MKEKKKKKPAQYLLSLNSQIVFANPSFGDMDSNR